MVAVKEPTSNHDFVKDPIRLRVENGWLYATHTTLGADDGMGIALAIAAALDKNVKHGPLELLLTSDEEIGLIGASALKKCLEAKYLLNLDSEDLGEICISCAGGFRITFEKEMQREEIPKDYHYYDIKISGYLGGHSGVEINQYRGSAIKQLARVLKGIQSEIKIIEIKGGQAHNAIPAVAQVRIAAKQNLSEKVQQIFKAIHEPYAPKEKDAKIELTEVTPASPLKSFSNENTKNLINFLLNTLYGPLRFS